jgi:CRISPR system Cascade subunit CasA
LTSFNALYQSWIPVIGQDGRHQELGIMETLTKSHELKTIANASPLVEFGIYRLLIAFIIDAFGINEIEKIEELLGKGQFNTKAIEDYVSSVGIDRFDLFNTEHPFLQSPQGVNENAEHKSVAELFQHLPTGTFATHFHHAAADEHAFSPATCLKGLTTIAPFMTAGGAGYSPSINGNPPWYVLVNGKSLFETILLNCYVMNSYDLGSLEGPAWRSLGTVKPKEEKDCTSIMEALTWRPRKVVLIPGEGGLCTYSGVQSDVLVRKMVFSYGFKFRGTWIDPQVAFRITDEGVSPLRPREEREVWRDTGAFLLLKKELFTAGESKVRFDRPLIVEQYLGLQRKQIIPRGRPVAIEVFGMRTDGKMKVFEWQHESLKLPDTVAHHPGAAMQIQSAMALADLVEYCLGKALKMAYPREGAGNSKALNNIIRAAKQSFWSKLHPKFEDTLIAELADQDPIDLDAPAQLAEQWKNVLRQIGKKTFAKAVEPFDQDAEALRRLVNAENYFSLVLRFSKPSKDKKEGRKQVS